MDLLGINEFSFRKIFTYIQHLDTKIKIIFLSQLCRKCTLVDSPEQGLALAVAKQL
jgi:hypothetical protein